VSVVPALELQGRRHVMLRVDGGEWMHEEGAGGVALGARGCGAAVRRKGGAGAGHGGGWWVGEEGGGRGAEANKMAAAGRGAAANKMAAAGEEGPAAWRRAAGKGWGSSGRLGSQGGPGLVIPCREREIRGKHHTQIRGVTSHIYIANMAGVTRNQS
jgi:hypothetical protein